MALVDIGVKIAAAKKLIDEIADDHGQEPTLLIYALHEIKNYADARGTDVTERPEV